jgi:hypothetical protein
LGLSISGDGQTVAVSDYGSLWVAPDGSTASGKVYVLKSINGSWVLGAVIKQDDGPWGQNRSFASDVVVDELGMNLLIIGEMGLSHFQRISQQWIKSQTYGPSGTNLSTSRDSRVFFTGAVAYGQIDPLDAPEPASPLPSGNPVPGPGSSLPLQSTVPNRSSGSTTNAVTSPVSAVDTQIKAPMGINLVSRQRIITVSFSRASGTQYQVVGRIGKTSKKFRCRSAGKKMRCTAESMRKGTWTISIDSTRGSASSKTILKKVRVR